MSKVVNGRILLRSEPSKRSLWPIYSFLRCEQEYAYRYRLGMVGGGSDPLVMSVHGVKGSQAKGIVDPMSGADVVYTDVSRIKQLAEQYLNAA